MTTYDYYKNQTSHKLYYNQYLSVDKNENGQITVIVESTMGTPLICRKGVWQVKGDSFIPEGDPEFNDKADKLVWGRFVKGEEVEREILDFSDYDKMVANFD